MCVWLLKNEEWDVWGDDGLTIFYAHWADKAFFRLAIRREKFHKDYMLKNEKEVKKDVISKTMKITIVKKMRKSNNVDQQKLPYFTRKAWTWWHQNKNIN